MTNNRVNTVPVFSGRTVRLLCRYGGQYIEQFRWGPISEPTYRDDENVLLDVYEFHEQPKLGPILAYERELDSALSPEHLRSYFEGNTAPRASLGNEVEDIRSVPPISEESFWSIVGTSGGSSVNDHLEQIQLRLEACPLPVAEGFMNRLALVLHSLDRASFSLFPRSEETGEDVSLTLRCWAVLRGREFCDSISAAPNSLEWASEAAGSEELIDVVTSRISEHLGVASAFVTTIEPWFTGSNFEYWGESPRATPDLTDFSTDDERIAEWKESHSPELRSLLWGEDDAIWDDAASRWWRWISLRAISRRGSSIIESIAVMAKPNEVSLSDTGRTLRAFIEELASERIPPELWEVADSRISRLSSRTGFFEIYRPAKVKQATYIEQCLFTGALSWDNQ